MAMLYPMARAIVGIQSRVKQIQTMGKRQTIHFEKPYSGERIVLIALYQKGELRPDLLRLIRAAKAQGFYVLGVNTLHLRDPDVLQGLIDCYIERPNFGRDFGSYKTGFLHLYDRGWAEACPRLLMINDSIYYSTRGLDNFLTDMMTLDTEVIGATENYEIEYHLGSFCIAMAQSIVCNDRIKRYWRNYRETDVRPRVIKRGEMKLSKTLKRCVSGSSQFRALYSSDRFLNEVRRSHDLQDLLIRFGRTSNVVDWPRFDPKEIMNDLHARFLARKHSIDSKVDVTLGGSIQDLSEEYAITSRQELFTYLLRNVFNESHEKTDEIMGNSIAAHATKVFMSGSQIHQNAIILLLMGLPIIKLDGMYRGMFGTFDIIRLQENLPEPEDRELSAILMERPFGGDVLVGWQRAAFMRGLI